MKLYEVLVRRKQCKDYEVILFNIKFTKQLWNYQRSFYMFYYSTDNNWQLLWLTEMLVFKYLYYIFYWITFPWPFSTLMLFWLILGQRKISLVAFLWKNRTSSVVFLTTMLFLIAYIRPLEIILTKKRTELVLLFHKKSQLS